MEPARQRVLELVTDRIIAIARQPVTRVAVDGVDGAGKTVFADELATGLERRGAPVIRASIDGFHHPKAVRYARGRDSPEGFFLDSYDLDALRRVLLDPLGPGGDRRIVRAIHDVVSEQRLERSVEVAPEGSVLVFDGIFLHRPDLVDHWDLSVFLDVGFDVSVPRGAARGFGDPDPSSPSNRRYVDGQRLYLERCRPQERASLVIDNTDLAAPRIVSVGRVPPGGAHD